MSKRPRAWVFTLNNPTEDEINALKMVETRFLERIRVALETGESGTPHLQGAVRFTNGRTLTGVKRFLGSDRYHLEKMRGTDVEAFSYCSPDGPGKSAENCEVIFEYGEMPIDGEADLSVWEQIIIAIDDGWSTTEIIRRWPGAAMRAIKAIEQYRFDLDWKDMGWRDIEVNYLSGRTGSGKTRYVMEKHGYHNVYRVTNKQNPWDGYNGEPVVVFEEFRNTFKIEQMLNWLDGYPVRLPARYADKCAKFTEVWIISNWCFYDQYQYIQEHHNETWNAWSRRVPNLYTDEDLDDLKSRDAAQKRDEEE